MTIYSRFGPEKYIQLAQTSFSILVNHEFLPAEESPFGMNTHSARTNLGWTYGLVKECYAIGAMTIREDYEWSSVERQKGVYTYTFPCSDMIYNRNMNYIYVSGFNNKFYDNGATPYTNEGRTGFANYSKAMFDLYPAYTGGLKYMEVFNEWWGKQFGDRKGTDGFDGSADSLPETYVPLAKKVYETVKASYPDSVLFGEFGTEAWNNSILDLGIADYMDAAAIHTYPGGTAPEKSVFSSKFTSLKAALSEVSDREFDIWVTETGYNTAKNNYNNVTIEEQAIYLPRTHLILLAAGAKKILWYDLLNDGTDMTSPIAHEDNFGLLNALGSAFGVYTPKPAFVSYAAMTRALDGKQFESVENKGDTYCYRFSNDNESISAVYSLTPTIVSIASDKPVSVTNIMGSTTWYTPENGYVVLPIDECVQYVTGDVVL